MKTSLLCAIATASVMAGCATSKPIPGPNGTTAYFIKCGSAVIDKCYEEAAKVCPTGYSLLDRDQSGNLMLVPVGTSLMMARGPNTMLVQCKP